jgi:hypothetical protein
MQQQCSAQHGVERPAQLCMLLAPQCNAGDRDSSHPSAAAGAARTSVQASNRRTTRNGGGTGGDAVDRQSRGVADRPSRTNADARSSLRLVHGSTGEDVTVLAVQGRAGRAQQAGLASEVMEHLRSATPGEPTTSNCGLHLRTLRTGEQGTPQMRRTEDRGRLSA